MDKEKFKRDVIKHSSIPFVAAIEGEWINADGDYVSMSEMNTDYLKRCLNTIKINSNAIGEIISLKNYSSQKITDDNQQIFIDYLDELINKKRKELEKEISKR